jgi:hypothetical protein
MRRANLVVMLASILVAVAFATRAEAQTPPPTSTAAPSAMGVISGSIRNGTAGAPITEVIVQLITVPKTGAITAHTTTTVAGRFRFAAPADGTVTYLLRAEYAGVPYIDELPVLISPEAPTVEREMVVWETTTSRPALRSEATVVSVLAVDRASAQMQLQREDLIVNPTDRVYIGGPEKVTLRFPAPEGLVGVREEQAYDGVADTDGQTITSTRPLRPGVTRVVTDMVVGYDPAVRDTVLRVTAPLPTERLEVRVPERAVDSLRTMNDAVRAPDLEEDGAHWLVARRGTAAREGESVVVALVGLSGQQAENALTSKTGAAAAVVAVLLVVGGTLGVSVRRARAAS